MACLIGACFRHLRQYPTQNFRIAPQASVEQMPLPMTLSRTRDAGDMVSSVCALHACTSMNLASLNIRSHMKHWTGAPATVPVLAASAGILSGRPCWLGVEAAVSSGVGSGLSSLLRFALKGVPPASIGVPQSPSSRSEAVGVSASVGGTGTSLVNVAVGGRTAVTLPHSLSSAV